MKRNLPLNFLKVISISAIGKDYSARKNLNAISKLLAKS